MLEICQYLISNYITDTQYETAYHWHKNLTCRPVGEKREFRNNPTEPLKFHKGQKNNLWGEENCFNSVGKTGFLHVCK